MPEVEHSRQARASSNSGQAKSASPASIRSSKQIGSGRALGHRFARRHHDPAAHAIQPRREALGERDGVEVDEQRVVA